MTRLGGHAGLLVLVLAAGCAVAPQRTADTAPHRSDQTGHQCPGELLLVDAKRPIDDRTAGSVSAAVAGPAIAAASRYTVAVRAYRTTPGDERSLDLFASRRGGSPPERILVEGSGVVIDPAGLILTNHHVVGGAAVLDVWAGGVGWMPARIVGTDAQSDLAVIAVDARLPASARWAEADTLHVGQAVVALGYVPGREHGPGPQALPGRLTRLHRSLQSALDPTQERDYGDLLECTVPLEPGHSGGPLIDRAGAVVGINTASVTHRRSGRRSGYAIRGSAHVRSVIAALCQGRDVSHGYLGVLVCADGGAEQGALVEGVIPGGPADRAGVRPADLIVGVAGSPVRDAAQLAEAVRGGPLDRAARLGVRRGRRRLTLTCTLTARNWRP